MPGRHLIATNQTPWMPLLPDTSDLFGEIKPELFSSFMDFSNIKPTHLILVLVLGFAVWKIPEALRHSQKHEPVRKELNSYVEAKDQPLSKADSLEIQTFLASLGEIFTQLDTFPDSDCQLKSAALRPRILDWNLLWYMFRAKPEQKSRDAFFDRVSTLNSQNPFSQLSLTVGDGFTSDLGLDKPNGGTLGYIRTLNEENLIFLAKMEEMQAPRSLGDKSFEAGSSKVGIWACDLANRKVLCRHTLTVSSNDSRGLPLKTKALNNKLRLELLEKTVQEVQAHCKDWMGSSN